MHSNHISPPPVPVSAAEALSEADVDALCPPRPETAAAFRAGAYPPAGRPYREAALRAFAYMASLPAMRTLVETGEPLVRFGGAQLATLMSIRRGEWSFDDIMALADEVRGRMLSGEERLPVDCDKEKVDEWLEEVMEKAGAV